MAYEASELREPQAQYLLKQELGKLVSGGIWNFTAVLSTKILPNLLVIILALLISPAELGVYSFIISTYTVLSLIADFGIVYSLQKFMQESPTRATSLSTTSFAVRVVSSFTLAAVSILLDIRWRVFQGQSLLISLLLVTSSFGIFVYALNARMEYRKTSLLMILRNIISFSFSLLLVAMGVRIAGPIYSLSGAYVIVGVLTIILARSYFSLKLDWTAARKMIYSGIFMTIATTLNIFVAQFGILALTFLSSRENVGIYKIATTFGMLPMLLGDGIILPLLPLIKKAIHEGNDHAAKIIVLLTRYLIVGGLAIVTSGLIAAKPLISLLYGARYQDAVWPLRILLLAGFLGMIYTVIISILLMSDSLKRASVVCIIVALLCVGCNLAMVPKYTMMGAALSVCIAFTLGLILAGMKSRALFHFHFEWKKYSIYAISSAEITAILWMATRFLKTRLFQLAEGILVAPVLYLMVLYAQKGITKLEIKKILELIRARQ